MRAPPRNKAPTVHGVQQRFMSGSALKSIAPSEVLPGPYGQAARNTDLSPWFLALNLPEAPDGQRAGGTEPATDRDVLSLRYRHLHVPITTIRYMHATHATRDASICKAQRRAALFGKPVRGVEDKLALASLDIKEIFKIFFFFLFSLINVFVIVGPPCVFKLWRRRLLIDYGVHDKPNLS